MDEFEKYIRENRPDFDRIEQVDADALWENIHQPGAKVRPLPPKHTGWHLQVGRNWQLTAAAAVVLVVGLAVFFYQSPVNNPTTATAKISLEDYYPDLAREERDFRRTIAQKEAELKLHRLDRQQFIDIFNELDELEQIHRQQMEDLPEIFNNEEWVSTLMRYYEQKLRILERLSREIDKQEQVEERSRARSI